MGLPSKKMQEIIAIKSMRWKYSQQQHLDWIEQNISPSDYHILIYSKEQLVSYANLVAILLEVDGNQIPFMGIGNVCTVESGKGYGNLLMQQVNEVLLKNDWKGILFCKEDLVSYYRKFSWELISKNKIEANVSETTNILIFNFDVSTSKFRYYGCNF